MRKEWTFTLEAAELAEAYQFMASLLPRNKRRRLALLLCVPALTLFTVFYFHWNGQPAAWVAAIGLCGLWIGKVSGWLWTIYLHNQVSSLLQQLPDVHYTPVTASFGEVIKIGELSLTAADLQSIVPLKHALLFFHHQDQMFIVPNRVIGSGDEIKTFCQDLLRWQKQAAAGRSSDPGMTHPSRKRRKTS